MNWYIKIGDPILATGIMSFVMHEVRSPFAFARRALSSFARRGGVDLANREPVQAIYFGRCLPWMLIDYMGWFRQYKLQAVSPCSRIRRAQVEPRGAAVVA